MKHNETGRGFMGSLKNAAWAMKHPKMFAQYIKTGQQFSLADWKEWSTLTGVTTWAGPPVSPHVLQQIPACYSAIRLISETIATTSLHLYQKTATGRRKATDHYLYNLIHWASDEQMTSVDWLEGLTVSLCVYGQTYNRTIRIDDSDPRSRIVGMRALPKNWVQPRLMSDGSMQYTVTAYGKTETFNSAGVMPIKGYGGAESMEGLQTWNLLRQSFSLSIAAEEYGARFFGQGATPRGVLMHEKTSGLSKEQREGLRSEYGFLNGTMTDAHKIAVLEAGMKYVQISSNSSDAQVIETRQHQVAEVARIFRIPLDFLMQATGGTDYANSEQRNGQLLTFTLRPYMVRIEKSLSLGLLTPQELRDGYYFEFDPRSLLRGDARARAAYYQSMRMSGAITQNEIRDAENLPYAGPEADQLFVPLNYAPLDRLDEIQGSEK